MAFTLDLVFTRLEPGRYQVEGRPAAGTGLGPQTFNYRPELLATHQQLKRLEAGALLSGALGQAWTELRTQAQAAGQPVRLRLHLAAETPELHHLPWEFLHDGDHFLAPDRQVLLSRGVVAAWYFLGFYVTA